MTRSGGNHELTATLAKAYMREMLDLNPVWQSPEIIRRRREIWSGGQSLGVAKEKVGASAETDPDNRRTTIVSPGDAQADQRLRDRARRCLETLEAEFYQLPDEKIDQYLRFLQSDRLPEYAAKASHLRRVADQRPVLVGVGNETDDAKFTYSLLSSLICPAAQAGPLREQYIEAIVEERRVVPACKMVKEFVTRHPEIYQLERDWFDLLLDAENCKLWSAKYSWRGRYRKFVGNGKLNTVALVVGLVFAIVVGVIGSDDGERNRPRRYYNNRPPATFPRTTPSTAPKFAQPSETDRGTLESGETESPRPYGSLGSTTGLRPPVKDAQQIISEMRERNEKLLESHQAMIDDLNAMKPGSSLLGTDPSEMHQELLRPSISIPEFPTPGLRPNRYRNAVPRPGQLRRPLRPEGMQ